MVFLRDAGHDAGDAEAVGAHGHGRGLAVLVKDLEIEGLGVLAAEFEDLTDLDTAGQLQRTGTVGCGVAEDHLGGFDGAVSGEVTTGDEVEDVAAGLVGAGDPAGAVDDARVEEVADLRGAFEAEDLIVEVVARSDVALDELRVGGEVLAGGGLEIDLAVAEHSGAGGAVEVDLTVAGRPMTMISRVPSGWVTAQTTFLSVSAAVQARSSRGWFALAASTRVSIVGVSGVSSTWAAGEFSNGIVSGTIEVTASTLAAYPPGERTKVSSPTSEG